MNFDLAFAFLLLTVAMRGAEVQGCGNCLFKFKSVVLVTCA